MGRTASSTALSIHSNKPVLCRSLTAVMITTCSTVNAVFSIRSGSTSRDQDITLRVDAEVADGSVVLLALSQLALPSEVVMRGPDDEDALDLVLL